MSVCIYSNSSHQKCLKNKQNKETGYHIIPNSIDHIFHLAVYQMRKIFPIWMSFIEKPKNSFFDQK